MIPLTRLDGKELWVNSDQVLTIEATPDTVLFLHGGQHLMVREPPDEVVDRIVAFRRRIAAGPERRGNVVSLPRPPDGPSHPDGGGGPCPPTGRGHGPSHSET